MGTNNRHVGETLLREKNPQRRERILSALYTEACANRDDTIQLGEAMVAARPFLTDADRQVRTAAIALFRLGAQSAPEVARRHALGIASDFLTRRLGQTTRADLATFISDNSSLFAGAARSLTAKTSEMAALFYAPEEIVCTAAAKLATATVPHLKDGVRELVPLDRTVSLLFGRGEEAGLAGMDLAYTMVGKMASTNMMIPSLASIATGDMYPSLRVAALRVIKRYVELDVLTPPYREEVDRVFAFYDKKDVPDLKP